MPVAAGADHQQLELAVVLQFDVAKLVAPRVEHVVIFDVVFAGTGPNLHAVNATFTRSFVKISFTIAADELRPTAREGQADAARPAETERARRDSNSQPSDTFSASTEVRRRPLPSCRTTGYEICSPPESVTVWADSGAFVSGKWRVRPVTQPQSPRESTSAAVTRDPRRRGGLPFVRPAT
jgi:hypothetical protein